MHDGLELESRGVPTAVICTEPFRQTVEAICETRGVAGFPFVIIDHPIGSLADDELQARAAAAAKQVIHILTTPAQM